MKTLIKSGLLVDPAENINQEVLDILIEDGKISKLAKAIRPNGSNVIDAAGKIVIPGLVDMHVHLREPGREDKETVSSGTNAAARGGLTTILAMANTLPAIDCPENVSLLKAIIKDNAKVNVLICAAITLGRKGEELSDFPALKKSGVVALSDDGSSVDDDKLFLEALKRAKKHKLLIICHCEDKALSKNGMVNAGFTATRMGLRGISKESEYKRVKRDIDLAEKTGAAIHIAHLSCAESVEIVAKAKKRGVKVTCETAPHYFSLTEEAVLGFDANMKMNPPLRAKSDSLAIKQGLKDGTIDVIASDHAPHTENEKDIEFERAEFGVIGLETELAAAITELINPGILAWPDLVKKMSLAPAKILGINKGSLSTGSDADIVIVDPGKEWPVRKEDFLSKSKNCAFLAKKLQGVVEYTICAGKIVYKNEGTSH